MCGAAHGVLPDAATFRKMEDFVGALPSGEVLRSHW
jgi:hypothetical protein